MEYRTFGRTGITVSEIGFGAWAIGGDAWGEVDDRASVDAIRRALECGVTLIDTADVYGGGRSERLVAAAVRGRRQDVVISTKGGLMEHHRDPARPPVYDQPEKVLDALDASLRRLETDHVDLYWCHIWWDDPVETDAFIAAFDRMKRAGKALAVGISTDSVNHVRHYDAADAIDGVQLDYSVLNRAAEAELLPYCVEQQLGVVARGPLFKGFLTGKFTREMTFSPGDIRESWPDSPEFEDRVHAVDALDRLTEPDETLSQLALRFVLAHPAVSAAIPGAKTAEQVDANARASRRPLLGDDVMEAIRAVPV